MYSYLLAAEDSEAPRGTSTVDGGEVSGTGTSKEKGMSHTHIHRHFLSLAYTCTSCTYMYTHVYNIVHVSFSVCFILVVLQLERD